MPRSRYRRWVYWSASVLIVLWIAVVVVGFRAAGRPSVVVDASVRNDSAERVTSALFRLEGGGAKLMHSAMLQGGAEERLRIYEGDSSRSFMATRFVFLSIRADGSVQSVVRSGEEIEATNRRVELIEPPAR